MKKYFPALLVSLSLLSMSFPVLAANNPSPPQEMQRLKTQLLHVRQEQKVSKVKIKKNIAQVKTHLKQVKKERMAMKHKRVLIKQRALRAKKK